VDKFRTALKTTRFTTVLAIAYISAGFCVFENLAVFALRRCCV